MLENKNAIVHGAGGAIGGAVARTFARHGARVFLAGRTTHRLDQVAADITAAGGTAEVARVDALEERSVNQHAADVARRAGRLDVSFNAVGLDNGEQGLPLVEMSAEDYCRPINDYTRTHSVTARAAAQHMTAQRSGVIMPVSIPLARVPAPMAGSFGQAFAAVEHFARQLAAELGPSAVRVVCLRPAAIPETAALMGSHLRAIWDRAAARQGIALEQFLDGLAQYNALPRVLTVAEVADQAAFLASDLASGMTGTVANISCGSVTD